MTSDAGSSALTDLDATQLSRVIHGREASCEDVMRAYLARWDRINPTLNALVNRRPAEALLAEARARDAELAAGRSRGWLHGIPLAIKDTSAAQGFPWTLGCRPLADQMPADDAFTVARIRAAGPVLSARTNVPEFGLGSHTFNDLFGATGNAWDPAVTAGGSSGGACSALASRMLPVADGSDFMGSLRNPAAWHNVFGLRPSIGLLPVGPAPEVWANQFATEGPLARTVQDLARLLATQAGRDARAPASYDDPALPTLADSLPSDAASLKGLRIGWWGNLQGHLATEDGVLQACEAALARFAAAGARVEPLTAGFDAEALWTECWLVLRQAGVSPRIGAVLAKPGAREQLKPEALWEYDQGRLLTYARYEAANRWRTRLLHRMLDHFRTVDLIALPAVQVWPFPIAQRWPQQIAGRTMDTYHRWMECTTYATLVGLPAISVPAGFHANGRWPMGLQLIGAPRSDAQLLTWVAAYAHTIDDWLGRRPALA